MKYFFSIGREKIGRSLLREKMDDYHLLPFDGMKSNKQSNTPKVSMVDISPANQGLIFLQEIRKNSAHVLAENQLYIKKKVKELLSINIFFDLKLLRQSIEFITELMRTTSKGPKGDLANAKMSLKIHTDSTAIFIRELGKIQSKIAEDAILRTDIKFLALWSEYVLKCFITLCEALSEATALPIRDDKPDIMREYDEGLVLFKKDGNYQLNAWWQRSEPAPTIPLPSLYSFY